MVDLSLPIPFLRFTNKKLLEKISDFFFLDSILIFSIFFVNEATLPKTSPQNSCMLYFSKPCQRNSMGEEENRRCRENGSISHLKMHKKCTLKRYCMT